MVTHNKLYLVMQHYVYNRYAYRYLIVTLDITKAEDIFVPKN